MMTNQDTVSFVVMLRLFQSRWEMYGGWEALLSACAQGLIFSLCLYDRH